jgi:hypothetical protein
MASQPIERARAVRDGDGIPIIPPEIAALPEEQSWVRTHIRPIVVAMIALGLGCAFALRGIQIDNPLSYPLLSCVMTFVGFGLCKARLFRIAVPLLAFALPGVGLMAWFFYGLVSMRF